MLQNRIVSLLFILVLILGHHQSHATTPFGRIRKLSRFLAAVNTQEIPPAPRPDSDSGNGKDSTGSDKCLLSSSSCSVKKLTACLRYSGNDLKEVFLIVENTGESPIQVNVTFAPANTSSEISLTKHEVKEVNVTEKAQGSNVIVVLSASNESCKIRMKSSVLSGWKLPYATTITLTPLYGVYILFAALMIVGGIWGCCKYGRSERRVEGIPYQELEMGQVEDSNNNDIETAQDGWGETWDDDWDNDEDEDEDEDGEDEIREVKSPRSKANGHTSRQQRSANNTDGDPWENNWDD